ncbi:NADH-quinone oxidoreductase subunit NuoG [Ferrovum sp. PN-J185]|uniref:NADH-quinone oxidoreductase subunit NuoG n=1 Tax=Ferrovum sp. PN-J185 TaxID=1356306 RepID=UPI00079502F5|nr:NADH-quinone oxidoreductase subunit NuoG [Ferrovum sp. PN-J185]KXW56187.1 NADH-quinone oxidoreductase chain 3 [Ferrovum sp. PN-J185]MCC6067751.1 NADH-quinone oxidoreductase subunit NuoG [Ferrovum sp. PN-J185]MDE1892231.1 NADH-quinone oxidoreductase subunit G [Betaproteobacteria bacterium]MDE2056829.1 NADH-quinone oxidoreductase subunit G [Betaproteobacteria bacterium]
MALVTVEIDGQTTQVESGRTVMDAARKLGIKIPHFCYHRKLSIAANCRMCLVQVEKAPKPLPACATPATEGMKVFTHSEFAINAQKAVMEFLLINHPLDCPICDQGGECKLQDISVGYGPSASRFKEEKRVVSNKNLGPLIQTDMTRCILCTRCVRFGQEIAGIMELGVGGRGERSEVLAFVDRTVNSEISGNVIDLCPVGALTSKPFRYRARTWELQRSPSVSPHDAMGSQLVVQVKLKKEVVRVLPGKNDAINECWLSDRDRFGFEAVNSSDRLLKPMIKEEGEWREAEWAEALQVVVDAFDKIKSAHGANSLGLWASPQLSLEELWLAQKLMRDLGSSNIDHRFRQRDFSMDHADVSVPWLGMPIEQWSQLNTTLLIGSRIRSEFPLLAVRLRHAVKAGGVVHLINSFTDDLAMPTGQQLVGTPSVMPSLLAQVLQAAASLTGQTVNANCQAMMGGVVSEEAQSIAHSLIGEGKKAVVLGQLAEQHADYATLWSLAQELCRITGSTLSYLPQGANAVAAHAVGVVPYQGSLGAHAYQGLNAQQMMEQPRHALMVLGLEPEVDALESHRALKALQAADFVVAMHAFKGNLPEWADVILPIAPFTETPGTFVNMAGQVQTVKAAIHTKGESRPLWKVLRVLANLFDLPGYQYDTLEEVYKEGELNWADVIKQKLNNHRHYLPALKMRASLNVLERLSEVPPYQIDALTRRSAPLQDSTLGQCRYVALSTNTANKLKVTEGQQVRISQGSGQAQLSVRINNQLADHVLWLPSGIDETKELDVNQLTITVEAVS